jgi:hypothetical protein
LLPRSFSLGCLLLLGLLLIEQDPFLLDLMGLGVQLLTPKSSLKLFISVTLSLHLLADKGCELCSDCHICLLKTNSALTALGPVLTAALLDRATGIDARQHLE